MTPEAEAAHRPDSGEPITPTGRADHDLAWLPGDLTPVAHSHLKRGCSGCAFIAAIEREAAHRDSPLREALVRLTEIDQRTQVGDCITLINAALAAEPIAASSRLDVERLARAMCGVRHSYHPGDRGACGICRREAPQVAERLRATPEPEG